MGVVFYAGSFYPRVFEKMFFQSSEDVTMQRYLMAFPLLCSHFNKGGHPMCPEEVSVEQCCCTHTQAHTCCTCTHIRCTHTNTHTHTHTHTHAL